MNILMGIGVILGVLLAALFALILQRVLRDQSLPDKDDWLDEVWPQRYGPMERVLDDREFRVLAANPAISRRMLRRFRARRIEIFRRYLDCLFADYGCICRAIKILMVQSPADRPDLASLLARQRALFMLRLTVVQFRLSMVACGIGRVEVGSLVDALDNMRFELNSLLAAQPSCA